MVRFLGAPAAVLALVFSLGAGDPAPDSAKPLEKRSPSVITHDTPHLSLRASLSPEAVAPGGRLTLAVEVTPRPGMHVYAPGSPYRAIALRLEPDPLLHVHDPVYPEAELYLFKPLNEAVLVYSHPFRLAVDVTAGRTASQRAKLRSLAKRTISGAIEYQACDDRVCYLPVSIPVSWDVRILR